jgi:hypothetical protein
MDVCYTLLLVVMLIYGLSITSYVAGYFGQMKTVNLCSNQQFWGIIPVLN